MPEGLWMYAVTRDLDPAVLAELSGVADAPVRAVAEGELVAVVSPVPIDEFDEAALRRHLEDLDWLAATATAHDAVIAALAGAGTAMPLRLATVYRGEGGVREVLTARRAELCAALDQLTGRTEWGVKAFAEPAGDTGPATEPGDGTGVGYLRRRRAELAAREDAERLAAVGADGIHEAVAALAVAARRYPPQDRALSGTPQPMLLNGAYLVDDARAADVAATVARLADETAGVRVELTGPWAPYSFAGVAPR